MAGSMKRRGFLAAIASALAVPIAARAQARPEVRVAGDAFDIAMRELDLAERDVLDGMLQRDASIEAITFGAQGCVPTNPSVQPIQTNAAFIAPARQGEAMAFARTPLPAGVEIVALQAAVYRESARDEVTVRLIAVPDDAPDYATWITLEPTGDDYTTITKVISPRIVKVQEALTMQAHMNGHARFYWLRVFFRRPA
jgi:hypothetical protein